MDEMYCRYEGCENLVEDEGEPCQECEESLRKEMADFARFYVSRADRGACCGGTNQDTKCGQCGRHVGYDTNKPGRVA